MKFAALCTAIAVASLTPAAFAQTVPAAPAAPAAAAAKFNLNTPIADIVADPAAKAVLDKELPGISTHESYEMFKGMSLKQLQAYAADKLTPEVLTKTETALAAVR